MIRCLFAVSGKETKSWIVFNQGSFLHQVLLTLLKFIVRFLFSFFVSGGILCILCILCVELSVASCAFPQGPRLPSVVTTVQTTIAANGVAFIGFISAEPVIHQSSPGIFIFAAQQQNHQTAGDDPFCLTPDVPVAASFILPLNIVPFATVSQPLSPWLPNILAAQLSGGMRVPSSCLFSFRKPSHALLKQCISIIIILHICT